MWMSCRAVNSKPTFVHSYRWVILLFVVKSGSAAQKKRFLSACPEITVAFQEWPVSRDYSRAGPWRLHSPSSVQVWRIKGLVQISGKKRRVEDELLPACPFDCCEIYSWHRTRIVL